MKKIVMFVAIAVLVAALGVAISGPSPSPEKPVSTPLAPASAGVAPRPNGPAPNNAHLEYLAPSDGPQSSDGDSRAGSASRYFGRGLPSGCSGGSCCP